MKKIPGVDMEKAADLEILAEKLVMVPKEELIYIFLRRYAEAREDFAGQRKGSGVRTWKSQSKPSQKK